MLREYQEEISRLKAQLQAQEHGGTAMGTLIELSVTLSFITCTFTWHGS